MARNRITYIFAVVVLLVLVYSYEANMTYVALYTVLALPLLSLVLTLISRRHFLVFEHLTSNDILKGEETQYVISLKNNSFMPAASVRIQFKANSQAVVADFSDQFISIAPYKSQDAAFTITAKYRGHYEIGIADIVLYDFLGLFKFNQPHKGTLLLTVRPHVVALDPLPLIVAQEGTENMKSSTFEEDYAIISDLRKYRPTDGYKKVHWKATAKKNELISKNFQKTKRNTTAFIIENSGMLYGSFQEVKPEAASALEDAMMQATVSAIAQCVARYNLCALYYMGSGLQEYSGDAAYLYEVACDIRFKNASTLDFENYLSSYTQMQVDAENVIMIVKEITTAVSKAAQILALFGNNVVIKYFSHSSWQPQDVVIELMNKGIHCIRVDNEG